MTGADPGVDAHSSASRGALSFDEFLALRGRDRRLARLTHDIVLPIARGLEFGALTLPTQLPEGFSVEYVDYAADAGAGSAGAVRVDHVWTGAGVPSFAGSSYDFAIAAQVAQYVPNLLGWFRGIFASLRIGGVLNLSLPDRRFMFDVKRKPSTLGEALEAYHLNFARPSLRQVFDHTYGAAAVEPARLWSEDVDVDALPSFCGEHALALAYKGLRDGLTSDVYTLAHCWVFTPLSFLEMIEGASRLGVFSFVISQFASTEPKECEFFVCLRRDSEDDPKRLLNKQLGAIDYVRSIARQRQQTARALGRP